MNNKKIYLLENDFNNIFQRKISWEKMNNKTILITGAYGMIASYLCMFLIWMRIVKGIDITIIAMGRNENKAKMCFGDLLEEHGFIFAEGNLLSPSIFLDEVGDKNKQFKKIDYIIHSASIANPRFYSTNPVEVIEPNAIGTYNLLQFARNVGCESFLFFSSGDIYGEVDNPSNILEETKGKLDPLDLHSCYGESKRIAENMCLSFAVEYGVPTRIARIGHTYGPTMNIESDPRVFSSFMKCLIDGKDIVIHSDGLAKRPFCYIADAIAAYLLILLEGENGNAYNVSNSKEFFSIRELALLMTTIAPNNISVRYQSRLSKDSYLECKVNKDNHLSSKKMEQLGWQCEFSTLEGMKRVYHYLMNEK